MVKLWKPLFSDEASGVLRRLLCYRRGPTCAQGLTRPVRVQPATAAQESHRAQFAAAAAAWRSLSSAEQDVYSAAAPPGYTGWQWFLFGYINTSTWGRPDYRYRITCTIDGSKLTGNLSHFPVLVMLNASAGISGANLSHLFSTVGSNYQQVSAWSGDHATRLYIEAVRWDAVNNIAALYLSAAGWALASGVNEVFYIYYDDLAADDYTYIGPAAGRPEVYDADTGFVLTFAQDPGGGAGCILDSTVNGFNWTPFGSLPARSLNWRPWGASLYFDGSADYLRSGALGAQDPGAGDCAYECYMYNSSTDDFELFSAWRNDSDLAMVAPWVISGEFNFRLHDAAGVYQKCGQPASPPAGAWNYQSGYRAGLDMGIQWGGNAFSVRTNGAIISPGASGLLGYFGAKLGGAFRDVQGHPSLFRWHLSARSHAWFEATRYCFGDSFLTYALEARDV